MIHHLPVFPNASIQIGKLFLCWLHTQSSWSVKHTQPFLGTLLSPLSFYHLVESGWGESPSHFNQMYIPKNPITHSWSRLSSLWEHFLTEWSYVSPMKKHAKLLLGHFFYIYNMDCNKISVQICSWRIDWKSCLRFVIGLWFSSSNTELK